MYHTLAPRIIRQGHDGIMTTVRLGDELEARLVEIARLTGQPVSEIVREAVRRHCDGMTADRLSDRLADVVGAVASGRGDSRKTGRRFTDVVRKKHGAGRRRSK